jgi:membrane-associated phospholipid phosphatase
VRILIASALVAGSAAAVRAGAADPVDEQIRTSIVRLRTPGRDRVVRVATDAGSLYGLLAVAGFLEARGGSPRRTLHLLAAGVTAWTAAQGAKPLLPRERPYEAGTSERLVVEPAGTSWPSGHAAVAASMADVLGRGRGPFTRSVLDAAAFAVGLSRVYVGVHHASDVIAGLGIGRLSAGVTRWVARRR